MNTFSRLFLTIALITCFQSARAQDAIAPPSPSSNEKSALVVELLQTTGSINMIRTIMSRMSETMKQGRNADDQVKIDRFMDSLNPDELRDQIVDMYVRHFSVEELRGILAFYKSPVGQKFLREMPAMVQESMTMGQDWAAKKAAELQSTLDAEAAARSQPPSKTK